VNKTKLTTVIAVVLGIQLFVSISLSCAALKYYYKESVLPGVFIEGIDIGGLKYQQAVGKLKQELPWPAPDSLLVLVGTEGNNANIPCSSIHLTVDYEETVNDAIKYSQHAYAWPNSNLLFGTINNGHNLPARIKFDKEAFSDVLNDLATQFYLPPQDAQLALTGDNVTLFQDVKGRKLDIEATMNQLGKLPPGHKELKLQFKVIESSISSEDYKGINARLAVFVTGFSLADSGRNHNVKLASQLTNNVLVEPEEIFSMNKVLGPRSPESGYRQAPVIVGNKLINDYGGGVCQVVTTLYNAVLLSGLPVIERVPHTMPVPYAPLGKDATIAADLIDFKFLNNTKYPILIVSQIQQDKLQVGILGHREDASVRLIKIETEHSIFKATRQYAEDPSLSPGQVVVRNPGSDGYEQKTFEIVLENDIEIDRRLISRNIVEPIPELIALGPRVKNKGFSNK